MGGGVNSGRIMIVEDDFIIADEIAMIVTDAGYSVIGPIASVQEAEIRLATEAPDFAVVDANLRDASSAALAQALRAKGIPFCLCTGYRSDDLREFGKVLVLQKPVDPHALVATIEAALGPERPSERPGSPETRDTNDR